ncbi:hypothetical protein [Qaidamihabitans albus]|uniref:hypothetical protein n=1 Tax=Qaidamihabitans albus TaxID=2795733 RepID=UPI0018F11881|nr:hypothetical protein [Qaidamihabitans albus]
MYGLIWRSLPGPLAVRIGLAVVLAAAVGALFWCAVFPLLDELLPVDEVTVDH